MKIRWDSPFTPYTWGLRCDVCGKEDDPEGCNMFFSQLRTSCGDWDFCSKECARKHLREWDWNSNAPHPDEYYLGGCRDWDIKCTQSHREERRMKFIDAFPGWITFECSCGEQRHLPDTPKIRSISRLERA